MTPTEQLIPLLRKAAMKFNALGHSDIWNSDDYTDELGKLCQNAADNLKTGTLTDSEAKRLYFVFAPTCEWDDSVGDVDLGNAIFGLMDILYRDIALNK